MGVHDFRLLEDQGWVLQPREEGRVGRGHWLQVWSHLLSKLGNEGDDCMHHPRQCLDLVGEVEECFDRDDKLSCIGLEG